MRPRLLLLAMIGWFCSVSAVHAQRSPHVIVYNDALAAGWHDWSFAVDRDLASTVTPHGGGNDIAVTAKAWGCLALQSDGTDVNGLTTLSFWIKGGVAGGQHLSVILNGEAGVPSAYNLPPLTTGWSHVEVKLSTLGLASGRLKTIWIRNSTASDAPVFYVDDIEIR